MKTTISTLLATIAIALTASAAPTLLVETTITDHDAKGGKDVMVAPRISVESGKRGIIQVGNTEYAITPILLGDGTVDLSISVHQTDRVGKKDDVLTAPRMLVKLGEAAEIQIGQRSYTTKTSLVK